MSNGIIRPVPVPQYGRILTRGIRTFQDIKELQEEAAARTAEAERRKQIEALSRQAVTDPTQLGILAGLDPGRALGIQQIQKGQTERKQFQEEAASREESHVSQSMQGRSSKDQLAILDRHIDKLRLRGDDFTDAQELRALLSGTPEQNRQGQMFIQNSVMSGINRGFIKATSEQRTTLARNLDLLNDPSLTEEQRSIVRANLLGMRFSVKVNPDGSVSLVSGKGVDVKAPLEKRTLGDIEKYLVSAERNISDLNAIKKDFKPDYLTYLGKWKAFYSKQKEKLGGKLSPEAKSVLQGKKRFVQALNQFFHRYRHDITGAQAAWREIKNLKDATINPDLSRSEFEAAWDQLYSSVSRTRRLMRKIYREGFRGNFKNKRSKAAQQLDKYYIGGVDDSALARTRELRDSHTEEEILNILEEEGYNF